MRTLLRCDKQQGEERRKKGGLARRVSDSSAAPRGVRVGGALALASAPSPWLAGSCPESLVLAQSLVEAQGAVAGGW